MAIDAPTYDDDRELTDYIWRNYTHLLTNHEALTNKAVIGAAKADGASPEIKRHLQRFWGSVDDPAIAPALVDGVDAFRDWVRDRVLHECHADVFVNRCPVCSRVVRTPRAQQCLWCGHDWH